LYNHSLQVQSDFYIVIDVQAAIPYFAPLSIPELFDASAAAPMFALLLSQVNAATNEQYTIYINQTCSCENQ
jgi:hypothetical protein